MPGVVCENASDMGHRIINPQCLKGFATVTLTVFYDDRCRAESDTLNLCSDCAKEVEEDAQRHGYKTERG